MSWHLFRRPSVRQVPVRRRYSRRLLFENLEDRRVLSAAADIVFLFDESGSTTTLQQEWLADMVTELDAALNTADIVDRRYGLVGFGEVDNAFWAHSHQVDPDDINDDDDDLFGSAVQLHDAALNAQSEGSGFDDPEDGWDAVEHAISEYEFDPGAAVIFVLIQNTQGKTTHNLTLTNIGTLAALKSHNVTLYSVVEAPFDSEMGDFVYGVEAPVNGQQGSDQIAYVENPVPNGNPTIPAGIFRDGPHQITFGPDPTIDDDYVRLAWNTDGAAWNIHLVVGDESTPPDQATITQFNQYFVASLVNRVVDKIAVNDVVLEDDPILEINLGGGPVGNFIAYTDPSLGPNFVSGTNVNPVVPNPPPTITPVSNSVDPSVPLEVFQTALGTVPSPGDPTIASMELNVPATLVPNGDYVVELLFDFLPGLTQFQGGPFDVTMEDQLYLDNYTFFDFVAVTGPNNENELIVTDADVRDAWVKRYFVHVTDGLQIELFAENFQDAPGAILNGIRIFNAEAPEPPFVVGDYNRSGSVECDDYTVWSSTFGNTVTTPFDGADGNGNGIIDLADYVVWANAYGDVMADFDNDGSVGVEDYVIWKSTFGSTTDLRADANCNLVVDAADYVMWRDTFGSMVGAALFGVMDAFAQGLPPEVVGFALSAAGGSSFNFAAAVGSGEQLRSVPLAGANMIRFTFNQDVIVTQNALTLVNLDGTAPSVSSFAYDVDSQTATWTFTTSLADGRYLVRLADSVHNSLNEALDGEFTNPWFLSATGSSIFASGDGEAGGEFRFRFTVLAGDTDHNNVHGAVNYQNWKSYEPGMIYASNTTDEFDGDLSFGDVSLREAVHYANTAGVPTRIDLAVGRYNLTRTGFESVLNTDYNDLDILGNVTIVGAGPGATIIDPQFGGSPSSNYRAFEVSGSTRRLDISQVTLTGAIVWGSQSGGAAYVWNQGTLVMTDTAVVNNQKDTYVSPVGVGIRSYGGNVTLERTVFTNNIGYDGSAVHASPYGSYYGSLTIGESIFALNSSSTGTPNVKVTGAVAKTNLGKNLFDISTGGFFDVVSGTGDHQGTPHYVVTTVLDTFDHADNLESTSVREAVDKANTTAGVQEIWIPAWKFVLTRDRGSMTSDMDTAWGDLDIKQSLIIRGVAGRTSIAWKAGVVDKTFDLLGDYAGGADANSVSSADYVVWQSQNGSTGAYEQFAADGDDDGDVDANDDTIWSQYFGNTLQLTDVLL